MPRLHQGPRMVRVVTGRACIRTRTVLQLRRAVGNGWSSCLAVPASAMQVALCLACPCSPVRTRGSCVFLPAGPAVLAFPAPVVPRCFLYVMGYPGEATVCQTWPLHVQAC